MTDGVSRASRYAEYLRSPAWRCKRDAILLRAAHICEVGNCNGPAEEVHHLTYERLYREEPSDLIAICRQCHDALTDVSCRVRLQCLDGRRPDCQCPVCQYQRQATRAKWDLRNRLAQRINEYLHQTNLRLYERPPEPQTRYSGLWMKNLPPDLLCQQTGEPANTPEACGACDACRWVAALEADFERNQREGETDVCQLR